MFIDSFDVHPLNRWETFLNSSDQLVSQSELEILSSFGNTTGDEFLLKRGLGKSDAKFETNLPNLDSYTEEALNDLIEM